MTSTPFLVQNFAEEDILTQNKEELPPFPFFTLTLNYFRFKSDDTINSKGFSANYVIINEDNEDSEYELLEKTKI